MSDAATAEHDDDLLRAAYLLRSNRVHGAMELALQAVDAAVTLMEANAQRDIRHIAQTLATARPSMVVIANAVAAALTPIATGECERNALSTYAESLKRQWQVDVVKMRHEATIHIPIDILLTYSNSSTTRDFLISSKNRLRNVVIPEGRPIDDGKALARALATAGIPVTLITEAQMGAWVREVGAVVVGADTITPDGAVYNHIGTATLALLAREAGIPCYSLAHTLKIAPYNRPEDMNEENDPAEVWAVPPAGITVRNRTFDRTPPEQIRIVTEHGILDDALRAQVVMAHRAAWERLGFGQ